MGILPLVPESGSSDDVDNNALFSVFITAFRCWAPSVLAAFCWDKAGLELPYPELPVTGLFNAMCSAGIYLDNFTLGNGKCPPTRAITSTTTVCFLAVSIFMTPADLPHTAHSDWSVNTCKLSQTCYPSGKWLIYTH